MGVLVLQERPQYFEVAQDVGRGDVEDVLVKPLQLLLLEPRRERRVVAAAVRPERDDLVPRPDAAAVHGEVQVVAEDEARVK